MKLYTVANVMEMFQISKPSVYRLINQGELYTVDVFGTKFRAEVLEEFLKKREALANKDTFNYYFIPFKEETPLVDDVLEALEKKQREEKERVLTVEELAQVQSLEDVKKIMGTDK